MFKSLGGKCFLKLKKKTVRRIEISKYEPVRRQPGPAEPNQNKFGEF